MKYNDKLAHKYKFLRRKIIESYVKGCKILDTVKWVFAILFILFTLVAIRASQTSDNKAGWLIAWVLIIFFSINIFVITDYCKYLVKEKVIPYLMDDNQLEFGEYAIFQDLDEFDKYDDGDEEEETEIEPQKKKRNFRKKKKQQTIGEEEDKK